MEETLMMDDNELAEHITQMMDAESQPFNDIVTALEEAQGRGYANLEELKESTHL